MESKLEEIGNYLKFIRKSHNLGPVEVAELMHEYYPFYATATYRDKIRQLENGYRELTDALGGEEPQRTIFCLYLDLSEFTEDEKIGINLENSHFPTYGSFNFEPDKNILGGLRNRRVKKSKNL